MDHDHGVGVPEGAVGIEAASSSGPRSTPAGGGPRRPVFGGPGHTGRLRGERQQRRPAGARRSRASIANAGRGSHARSGPGGHTAGRGRPIP